MKTARFLNAKGVQGVLGLALFSKLRPLRMRSLERGLVRADDWKDLQPALAGLGVEICDCVGEAK